MANSNLTEVETKILLDEMMSHQKVLNEFNELGNQKFKPLERVMAVLPLLVLNVAYAIFQFETELFYSLMAVFALIALVYGMIDNERQKTNRRTDLLFKILKKEIGDSKNKTN